MARSKYRTYKADYENLYNNPQALKAGVNVRLDFPTGDIIVSADNGALSMRISVSNGPAGLGVLVDRHVGTPPITAEDGDHMRGMELCQYRSDEWAQQFKKWYGKQGDYPVPAEKPARKYGK